MKMRWTYVYGPDIYDTATVTADTKKEAEKAAREQIIRRHELKGKELPKNLELKLDKAWLPHD